MSDKDNVDPQIVHSEMVADTLHLRVSYQPSKVALLQLENDELKARLDIARQCGVYFSRGGTFAVNGITAARLLAACDLEQPLSTGGDKPVHNPQDDA